MTEGSSRKWWIGWLALGAPALWQFGLMMSAILQRLPYPYDLEWMEGGILNHAARIADGTGIYVEPSLDFIPFLYTPLYPGLLGLIEPITGINYQTGRAISVLSLLGIFALVFVSMVPRVARSERAAAVAGGLIALGFVSATYPWVEGWYDLVRADTMALAMSIAGVVAVNAWATQGIGWRGHLRIGGAAAILALAFFAKQTGIFFVAAGGAVVLVKNWRRVPVFVATSGAIGLGGTWMLDKSTGGWFWTYAFEVHQTHECNADRFWAAFGHILGKFPLMTAAVGIGLAAVAVFAILRRRLPRSCEPLLLWSWLFVVGILVGAVGIGTQWSERNAYIPAMIAGAVAAGAAVPALLAVLAELIPTAGGGDRRALIAPAAAMVLLAVMAVDLAGFERWSPAKFVPTARDRAAGDALIAEIRNTEGEVFVPFHPWYAHLAGKRVYTHRMGVLDMRFQPPNKMAAPQCFFHDARGRHNWKVIGLPDAFNNRYFDAVVWDNRPKQYFDGFTRNYRLDDILPERMRPKVYSGATGMRPTEIWVPAVKRPPPNGARVVFDFESGKYDHWTPTGDAWKPNPERGPLRQFKQGPVRRYGGRFFATSMHGGDDAKGVLTSKPFVITGKRITFKLSGGVEDASLAEVARDPAAPLDDRPWLRVELHVDGKIVRHSPMMNPPSERMTQLQWMVPEHLDATAQIVVVDNAAGSWAHLNVDEVWLWSE